MSLYRIQDPGRSLYVVSDRHMQAVDIWKKIVARENGVNIENVEDPLDVSFVCEDKEIVVDVTVMISGHIVCEGPSVLY